jgi:hypothetical protein
MKNESGALVKLSIACTPAAVTPIDVINEKISELNIHLKASASRY